MIRAVVVLPQPGQVVAARDAAGADGADVDAVAGRRAPRTEAGTMAGKPPSTADATMPLPRRRHEVAPRRRRTCSCCPRMTHSVSRLGSPAGRYADKVTRCACFCALSTSSVARKQCCLRHRRLGAVEHVGHELLRRTAARTSLQSM